MNKTLMTPFEIEKLNKRYGAVSRIAFRLDSHGFPVASLVCKYASAEVSLYGAHVLSYRPTGHGPVLFLSKKSAFEAGKPIRGGIPVCWPWFGKHPSDASLPMHGFARTSLWTVLSSAYTSDSAELTLGLADSPETKKLFPYSFAIQLNVKIGQSLRLELTTRNAGIAPMPLTEAFHPYLRVMRIGEVQVNDLNGAKVDDRLTGEKSSQSGNLRITQETDRVYFPGKPHVLLDDASLNRTIDVTFTGTKSLVVWNPWVEKSQRMEDFGDEEYTQMICLEPVNTLSTSLTLKPGEKHMLGLSLQAQMK